MPQTTKQHDWELTHNIGTKKYPEYVCLDCGETTKVCSAFCGSVPTNALAIARMEHANKRLLESQQKLVEIDKKNARYRNLADRKKGGIEIIKALDRVQISINDGKNQIAVTVGRAGALQIGNLLRELAEEIYKEEQVTKAKIEEALALLSADELRKLIKLAKEANLSIEQYVIQTIIEAQEKS